MAPANPITPPPNTFTANVRTAFGITLFTLFCSTLLDWFIYVDTARLPPGHEIRPMLFVLLLALSGIASILGGGGIALYALIGALKQKRWSQSAYALVAFVVAWIPFFAGFSLLNHIVALRKLVLEP